MVCYEEMDLALLTIRISRERGGLPITLTIVFDSLLPQIEHPSDNWNVLYWPTSADPTKRKLEFTCSENLRGKRIVSRRL